MAKLSWRLLRSPWAWLHALGWLVAALVLQQTLSAWAPQPLWSWQGGEGPSLVQPDTGQQVRLSALHTPEGRWAFDIHTHGLPPHVQPTLADKHAFEAMEERLLTVQGQQGLAWEDATGQRWPITWRRHDPHIIPTMAWVLLITAVLAWHVAWWNLSVRPRDLTTQLYVTAGLAFATGNFIRAWLCARPWALPTWAWDFQFIVSHTCGLAFLTCLLLMVLRVPRPQVSRHTQIAIAGVGITIELADAFHLVPGKLMATYQWPMAALAITVLLTQLWVAWRERRDPAYNAALRWIVLIFMLAVLPPVVLYAAWASGLIDTSLYDPVLIAPTLGYFALSALLHRHELLRLETWRSRRISLWISCLLTLALLTTLAVRGDDWMGWAVGITLLTCPWIYLAVRTVLTYRTPPTAPERLQALMPDVMDIATAQVNREAIAPLWQALVRKAFQPQQLAVDTPPTLPGGASPGVVLSRDGAELQLPHVDGLVLRLHANAQPFTATDAELAEALWRLVSHGLVTKDSYEAGVKRERRRIAADLHDSIGGRLLHLSQTAGSTHQRQYAINTLADLRNITRGLSRDGGRWGQVMADLRHQMQRELDAVDVDLHWQCDWPADELDSPADPEDAVALHCITSELVRNALQHAGPSRLSVHWHQPEPGRQGLRLAHDGQVSEPGGWQHGLGVNSIRRRLRERQGDADWQRTPGGELVFSGHWVPRHGGTAPPR